MQIGYCSADMPTHSGESWDRGTIIKIQKSAPSACFCSKLWVCGFSNKSLPRALCGCAASALANQIPVWFFGRVSAKTQIASVYVGGINGSSKRRRWGRFRTRENLASSRGSKQAAVFVLSSPKNGALERNLVGHRESACAESASVICGIYVRSDRFYSVDVLLNFYKLFFYYTTYLNLRHDYFLLVRFYVNYGLRRVWFCGLLRDEKVAVLME